MRRNTGITVMISVVGLTALFMLACARGKADCVEDQGAARSLNEAPPAAQAELSRSAPVGARAEGAEREIEHRLVTWSVEYETTGGDLEISVLEDGTLVALEHEGKLSALPPSVRAAAEHVLGGNPDKADYLQIAVYELEDTLEDGTVRERFVDPYGQVLLERRVAAGPENDIPETQGDLPDVVLRTLERETAGATLTRVQQELEWGHRVHAVSWQASDGPREVKILDDGQVLYTELPTGPLPPRVAALIDGEGTQNTGDNQESTDESEAETAGRLGDVETGEFETNLGTTIGGPERMLLCAWEVERKSSGHEVETLVLPTGEVLPTPTETEDSESDLDRNE